MSLTPEEIEQNYNRFRALCEKLGDRSEAALKMVDDLGEHLACAPASSRKSYHNCFPGGLVDHSLRVLQNAMTMTKAFGWKVPKDSLIIGALFHDIGKVGLTDDSGETHDFYVPQKEQWRADKNGELYSYNNDMQYMTTPTRSVFLCQRHGLRLTTDEYLCLLLNDGFVVDENKKYCLKISKLVYAIQTADYIATCVEKEDNSWSE